MNIFRLDDNPFKAAQYHADHHVGKMLLEACQLLATAHPEPDVEGWRKMTPQQRLERDLLPYMHTHVNHPCAIWVREGLGNYIWLADLAGQLSSEFGFRFGKEHAATPVLDWLYWRKPNRPDQTTAPSQAMPDAYKRPDPVEAYRAYYAAEKSGFWRRTKSGRKWVEATWTRRDVPWFMGVKP